MNFLPWYELQITSRRLRSQLFWALNSGIELERWKEIGEILVLGKAFSISIFLKTLRLKIMITNRIFQKFIVDYFINIRVEMNSLVGIS